MSRARRAGDDPEEVKAALAAARAKFLDAAKLYKEIPKKIEAQLTALKNDPGTVSIRADLTQAALRAALDEGITLFKAAKTYPDGDRERSNKIAEAQKKFAEIADKDLKQTATWLAKVWEARLLAELDKKKEADEIYQYLFNFGFRTPVAQPAIRLARSFQVDNEYDASRRSASPNFARTITMAESWLRQFGGYRDTPEGLAVRYVHARSLHAEARKGLKVNPDGKITGGTQTSTNLLQQAEREYRGLEESGSEYSVRAARYRMEAILARTEAQNKGNLDRDITNLKNFEECFLQAQVQYARLSKTLADPKTSPDIRKSEQQTRMTAVARLLERAFKVVEKTDPAGDLVDARLLQSYAYSMTGQPAKSAVLADFAARAFPKERKSPVLAGLALDNYRAAYFDGNVPGVVRPQESMRADLFRLTSMAEWLLKTHPTSPEAEKAHYNLGLAEVLGKGPPEKAAAELAKVGPAFPDFLIAKIYQAQSMYSLIQPNDTDPEKVKTYRAAQIAAHKALFDQTVAQLEAIPPTPADARVQSLDLFVKAKIQLAQFLQFDYTQAGNLAKISPILDAAIKVVDDNAALKEAAAAVPKAEYKAQLTSTRLAAVQYAAYLESKAGQLDKAAALLEPELKQAEAALAMPPERRSAAPVPGAPRADPPQPPRDRATRGRPGHQDRPRPRDPRTPSEGRRELGHAAGHPPATRHQHPHATRGAAIREEKRRGRRARQGLRRLPQPSRRSEGSERVDEIVPRPELLGHRRAREVGHDLGRLEGRAAGQDRGRAGVGRVQRGRGRRREVAPHRPVLPRPRLPREGRI